MVMLVNGFAEEFNCCARQKYWQSVNGERRITVATSGALVHFLLSPFKCTFFSSFNCFNFYSLLFGAYGDELCGN